MDFKRLFKKFITPPLWLIIILSFMSAGLLIYVFLSGLEENPIAYGVYVLSFYTLSVLVVFFIFDFPQKYKAIKEAIYKNPLGKRYMEDKEFRSRISLYSSLIINLIYVALNAFSAYSYRTYWFGILAFYYGILSIMRFLLVRYIRKHKIGEKKEKELKIARTCAFILTSINLVLSGAVLMILYQKKGFVYSGMLIYVMASYTFYMTATAIIDVIKQRSNKEPILLSSRSIKLASALVSMLSLETAMFSQFGADVSLNDKNLMIALTGAGVSIIIILTAIYIIIKSNKELKYIRSKNNGK